MRNRITFFFCSIFTFASALHLGGEPITQMPPLPSGKGSKAIADAAWERVWPELTPEVDTLEPIDGVSSYRDAIKRWGDNTVEFWSWWSRQRQRRREKGLQFWEQYPGDVRRFRWLLDTMTPPAIFFWRDVKQGAVAWTNRSRELAIIDETAKELWEKRYIALRAEFFLSPDVSAEQRDRLRSAELIDRLINTDMAVRRGERPKISPLLNDIVDFVTQHPEFTSPGLRSLLSLMHATDVSAMIDSDREAEANFIAALKLSPNTEVRWHASGWDRLLQMRNRPLELRLTQLETGEVEFSALRGKVVFVDVWSMYCSSCITGKPRIQALYEKYKDRGFEVVGICLLGDLELADKPRALKALKDHGVTYINCQLSGVKDKEFCDNYAISGMPVWWLLDQQGRLVTIDLYGPKLEREVRRLLGLSDMPGEK